MPVGSWCLGRGAAPKRQERVERCAVAPAGIQEEEPEGSLSLEASTGTRCEPVMRVKRYLGESHLGVLETC